MHFVTYERNDLVFGVNETRVCDDRSGVGCDYCSVTVFLRRLALHMGGCWWRRASGEEDEEDCRAVPLLVILRDISLRGGAGRKQD